MKKFRKMPNFPKREFVKKRQNFQEQKRQIFQIKIGQFFKI